MNLVSFWLQNRSLIFQKFWNFLELYLVLIDLGERARVWCLTMLHLPLTISLIDSMYFFGVYILIWYLLSFWAPKFVWYYIFVIFSKLSTNSWWMIWITNNADQWTHSPLQVKLQMTAGEKYCIVLMGLHWFGYIFVSNVTTKLSGW